MIISNLQLFDTSKGELFKVHNIVFSSILLIIRWPTESKFHRFVILGYTKWEYWSLIITKGGQFHKELWLEDIKNLRLVLS